ncbi:hypothetical protein I3760_05G063700 [Carya illinoinensis]|nr:hypothetical protein I3760_05G063700 [Carya illinoinensis]
MLLAYKLIPRQQRRKEKLDFLRKGEEKMRLQIASCGIIVYALLVLLTAQESNARKLVTGNGKDVNKKEYDIHQHTMVGHLSLQDDSERSNVGHIEINRKHIGEEVREENGHERILKKHAHAHPEMHMDHMDPALNVFLAIDDLKVGKSMPIYFPRKDPSMSPRLLPREEVDSIPFSSTQLPYLLEFFSFSKESTEAKAMEYTLGQCELEPIKGETKFCATSFESLLDFPRSFFGLNSRLKVITATDLRNSTVLIQNYTFLGVKEISAPKMIACHPMPYPYAVFYCHGQESENRLFEVSLDGENGETVQAAAFCHMDTSQWDPEHVSFRVLGVEPGSSPVCHFFPADNIIWVPIMSA